MIKRKQYLEKLHKLKNTEDIKVITGVRRCGKTTLLNQFKEDLINNGTSRENIIYISFELHQYRNIIDDQKLDKIIFNKTKNLKGKIYLMFDEIQIVKNWQKAINSYRIELDADIYITGSNSQLLSGELASLLSGRYITINMYPFSFKETLDYYSQKNNTKLTSTQEQEILENYLIYGGFPGIYKYEDNEKLDYLNDLYSTLILQDIINKNKLNNIELLERLIQFMINNIGNTFSATSISKYLKKDKINTTANTILNYLNYSMKAFLLYQTKREDMIGKKILTVNEKYYLVDLGFYSLFFDEDNRDLGHILENLVYLELIRRGYKVTIGKIYNLEVDFICKKHNQRKYIQVSQSIIDPNTKEREIKVFEKINDYYPKYIITLDNINLSHNGIKHVKLIDFLKEDNNEF